MRVLLHSHGSTGDIYPLIAYGRALREAGHEVRYASAPLYRKEIESAGLEFVPLPPSWKQELFTEFMRDLDREKLPLLQLRRIYAGSLPFLKEMLVRLEEAVKECDAFVCSYFFPVHKMIADRHGKPFAVFAFCHSWIPTPSLPPDPLPRLLGWPPVLRRPFYKMGWQVGNWLTDRVLNAVVESVLREAGYGPIKDWLLKPADLSIVAVSEVFKRARGKIDPRFQFVGYLRWQADEDPVMEEEILDFTRGAEVPVLTFGSVTFENVKGVMSRFEKNWPAGRKIILQAGWAGLSVDLQRSDILVVGRVSHDQLFRHASCVIHHGGAGTTASVLYAGKPHIIIPHIADQHFWAQEIRRLGVGISIRKKRWPEVLPRAVRHILRRKKFRARSARTEALLKRENGARRAVEVLVKFAEGYQANGKDTDPSLKSIPVVTVVK